ncbi:MAG TPA: glycoside hydrolase family 3 N-terminal domain-containing protein [Herpetosiphonaceae bacterium]|nr:glycoside hydrolase family 3 N-terminal domain-containing protein [Herpetosiphonaceae bacterium]
MIRPYSRRAFLKLTGCGMLGGSLLSSCGRQAVPAAGPAPSSTPVPGAEPSPTADPAPAGQPETPTPQPETPTAEGVSLDVKIGQMLMIGFRGLMAAEGDPILDDIRARHLGGVVLFDYDVPTDTPVRNVESPAQVKALVEGLQAAAAIPLLVAVDQEGGRVRRLKEALGFVPLSSPQSLGAANDIERTRREAGATAQMLAELGINLNLAPVVDLNTNADNPVIGRLERSFSADPAVVTDHALAFIRAHHEHQVLCSLKHFPGHGSSAADSHLGLVDVTGTWSSAELEPYARIIEAGEADTVMTAHVFNATLDPTYPATLSQPTIIGILRDRLHYGGVVLCDDLQMGAIREQYGYETAVEAVIAAGVDILVIANNTVYEEGITARTVAIIKQLIQDGKVSEARIDESHGRIQRLKSRLAPQPRNVS